MFSVVYIAKVMAALHAFQASSGVAACNTKAQEMQHIIDSPELFYSDTMSSGDYENDRTLVDILVSLLCKGLEGKRKTLFISCLQRHIEPY